MGRDSSEQSRSDWSTLLTEQARANKTFLFSLAFQILWDHQSADDACQKALLAAWTRKDEILDRSRLKGWLATAVINESLAMLRRGKTERRVLKLVAFSGEEATSGTPPEGESRRDAIVLALANLTEHERAVVTLRMILGLPVRDVAGMLNISNGQVSKLMRLGLQQLRTPLADWNQS